ncbi:MAG: TolC family outer membrane protein [Bilophila sp.]
MMRVLSLMTGLLCCGLIWQADVRAASEQQPVTIQDSINATLKHHRGLKTIQENREVVVHELRRAEAGWGPRLDFAGRAGSSRLSDTTTRAANADSDMHRASNLGLTLVQPLWDGYATRSRVRAAESTVDSVTDRVFDNATTLALDAIIAHIDLLRRREIFTLATKNVDRHREILESSKDREAMGADTMADVSQTRGRLSRALSTLAEARASLREGEDSYRRITGTPVPAQLDPIVLPDPLYDGPETIFAIAKKSNPKVNAYLNDVRAAVGNKELAESAYQPTINLEAGPNYSDRGGPGNQWTSSFDVMGTVRWNLFNSGADAAETKAALARVRQSRQFLYDFIDSLKLEVEDTWTGYISATEQYGHYTDAIGFNTQTRDSYLEQFMIGQRSLLDVLDAESELFNSSTQAATARGNILVGGYRMYALAGVLLQELHIDTKNLNTAPGDDQKSQRGWKEMKNLDE